MANKVIVNPFTGQLELVPSSGGGGGSPGGPKFAVQVNGGGSFVGTSNFTYVETGPSFVLNVGVLSMSDDGAGDGYIYSNTTSAQVLFSDTGQVRIKDSSGTGLILDGTGSGYFASNLTIDGLILDSLGVQSIDTNNRNLYGTAGATIANWDNPGGDHFLVTNVVEFSATTLTNGIVLAVKDVDQQVYVQGNFSGIEFSGETFTPGGIGSVNDLTIGGAYTSLMADEYTIILADNAAIQFNYNHLIGLGVFSAGDTITDLTSGATGTIFEVDTISRVMVITGIAIDVFSNGDAISNGTLSTSISSLPAPVDTITWSDTQSNSGIGLVQDSRIFLSNGLTISFLTPSATPRFIGDTWTISYSLISAPYVGILADYINNVFSIGDIQGEINNTYIASNVKLGVNQLSGNFDYQSANKTINALDPTDPQDYATKNYVDTHGGGGGSPGGPDTSIQYNSSGSFAGSANLTFDGTDLVQKGGSYSTSFLSVTPSTGIISIGDIDGDVNNTFIQVNDAGSYIFISGVTVFNNYIDDTGFVHSIDTSGRYLFDSSALTSVDYGGRLLDDDTSAHSIDWQNRVLSDDSARQSLLYNARELWDASSNIVCNWNTLQLSSPTTVMVDWSGTTFKVRPDLQFAFDGTTYHGVLRLQSGDNVEVVNSVCGSALVLADSGAVSLNAPTYNILNANSSGAGQVNLLDGSGFGLHLASGNATFDQNVTFGGGVAHLTNDGSGDIYFYRGSTAGLNTLVFFASNGLALVDNSGFGLQLDGLGNASFSKTVKTGSFAFASLPTPSTGMQAVITDSTANTFGATIAGSGSHTVLGWYNGSHWTVVGI